MEVMLAASQSMDGAIRKHLAEANLGPFDFYTEGIDAYRFHSEEYERELASFLASKYRDRKPVLIFALTEIALDFILRSRDRLWPDVPVVATSVDPKYLENWNRPPLVAAIGQDEDFTDTALLVRALQPDARRALIVCGTGDRDAEPTLKAIRSLQALRPPIEIDVRSGVPIEDFPKEFGRLPDDTIVLFTMMFRDNLGRSVSGREATAALAAASSVPVYAGYSVQLGTGVIGGGLVDFEYVGRAAAAMGARILRGEAPQSIPIQKSSPPLLAVDDRVLRRFGIPESRLPARYELHFRTPTFWEQYRWRIIAVVVALGLQTALIIGLLTERQSRKRAEDDSRRRRQELAHAARLATVGELAASISHEINQPLGAILANVKAVEMLHDPASANGVEVRQILADIRKDNLRAHDVIRHVRGLAANRAMEMEAVDVNALVSDVCSLLGAEARRRGVVPELDLDVNLPTVQADRVSFEQVLMNLVLNAMDAVEQVPIDRRRIVIQSRRADEERVTVAIRDTGLGISPEALPRLFESFFTTKKEGLGLGLSICRTILEAHGGSIRAENDPAGGASFSMAIPTRSPTTAARPAKERIA
jgi:signal transduction histidine kinase